MPNFICQTTDTGKIALSEAEARHAIQVLRLREGDTLTATDGSGHLFTASIFSIKKSEVIAEIYEMKYVQPEELPVLAVGIIKHPERMEWMVEKAVEIGVGRIQPLICEHSEKKNLRIERLQKAALVAMKQSGRVWLPVIDEPHYFEPFISSCEPAATLMAAVGGHPLRGDFKIKPQTVWLIGPEGDFSKREIEIAREKGIDTVGLGDFVLRTETAAIFALSVSRVHRF